MYQTNERRTPTIVKYINQYRYFIKSQSENVNANGDR
jgi:hypothetical protein